MIVYFLRLFNQLKVVLIMSFSKDIKREILENGFTNDSCRLSFLCGLAQSSAEYEVCDNEVKNFTINTDLDFLPQYLKTICKELFCDDGIEITPSYKISDTQYFSIMFNNTLAKNILLKTNILCLKNNVLILNENIYDNILNNEQSLGCFVAGVFIGCGTSSIQLNKNDRKATGYHLELNSQNYMILREILDVLAEFEILAKLTQRKNIYVLYIKESEAVSNTLALMGASEAVLKLQNEIITRQIRNKINRQNNCYTSNFTKTLNASFKQLDAINLIEKEVGLYNLPEDLQQVALLRLANTEESLDELLRLSKYPLTKSALNYKYNKLIKLAEKIKGKSQ